jgi:hypothetical protein
MTFRSGLPASPQSRKERKERYFIKIPERGILIEMFSIKI